MPAGFLLTLAATAGAQYTTHVEKAPDKPTLRSVAVLEWTGELAKPSSSRLIPIAVWDGERYQPGGLYLAQPAPLALLTGTQYELEKAGEPTGFFNVRGAATLGEGSWIGVGRYQPVPPPPPPPKLKASKKLPTPTPTTASKPASEKDAGTGDAGDRPTLHRKTDDSAAPASSTTSDASKSTTPGPAEDPDKPTLHRRTDADSASSTTTGAGTPAGTDPDKPTLHKKADDQSASDDPDRPTLHRRESETPENAPDVDPDRPTLRRAPPAEASGADVGSAPGAVTASLTADPDRPALRRGKPGQAEAALTPTKLESTGLPILQMVAVSDVKRSEPHPYAYHWNSPEDEAKMRAAMETLAAQALAGRSPGSFGPASKAPKTRGTAPALTDEHFESYELAYSSGPTLVLSAQGGAAGDRYVTLIAQPDFYNQPRVLLRQVSTAATLDQTPRMQLVDAVDTDDDHQAELIFELIGSQQIGAPGSGGVKPLSPNRQYAIYRVSAVGANQVFATGPLP